MGLSGFWDNSYIVWAGLVRRYVLSLGPVIFLLFLLTVALAPSTVLPRRFPSVVLASSGDFTFSASPSAISISHGATSTSTMMVTGQGGYSGNVTFSIAETYDSIDIPVSM